MRPITTRTRRVSEKTLFFIGLGFSLFAIWQAVDLYRYNQIDTRPPSWDQAVHMEIAWDYLHALKEGHLSDIFFLPPKPGMPPFPPLYHLGLMFSYLSSDPAHAALWVNWAYFMLLCGALLGIGLHFRDDEIALVVVISFAGAPAVQWLLHNQLIDLSLIALSACAYLAFLKSERFNQRGSSLALGLIHAVGLLHKWSFFSYMLPIYAAALWFPRERGPRRNVLLAASLSAIIFLPWYLVHLPVLLPRLFQASTDQAVPFWKGGAVFEYFLAMSGGLGPPLWILGCIGLVVPVVKRRRDDVWILVAWALTSYIFWTIVPNRQMRFLLPGLPALAALALGSWPKPILWTLAAFQLFTAANYTAGWVQERSIPLPLLSLDFFASAPPAREDWKIPDILDWAHRLRPQDKPFSNLTLVANDNYLNGPTFNWEVKRLGLSDAIKIRGVNQRLCEFSDFVVLKKGRLGPPSVISGLPEMAQLIATKEKWFRRAYDEAGVCTLPDNSLGILYQQKKPRLAPFSRTSFIFRSYSVPSAPFTAINLKIALKQWDSRRSVYGSALASADLMELRGLYVHNLKVELQDALIIPAGYHPTQRPWEDVRFLKIGKLRIVSLRIEAEELKKFVEERAKGLAVAQIELNDGIRMKAVFHHIPLSAEAQLSLEPRALIFYLKKIHLGPIPIPPGLIGRYRKFSVPLDPNPETPFTIEIPGLTIKNNTLTIP